MQPEAIHQRVPRPRGVTMLVWLVLILAVLHLTRLEQSLARWEFLRTTLPFSPIYLAINGALWGLVGLVLTWALWFGKVWAPRLLSIAALLFTVSYWFERVVMSGSPNRNINWPFAVGVNLLVLVFIIWQIRRKKVMYYFGEMHVK